MIKEREGLCFNSNTERHLHRLGKTLDEFLAQKAADDDDVAERIQDMLFAFWNLVEYHRPYIG